MRMSSLHRPWDSARRAIVATNTLIRFAWCSGPELRCAALLSSVPLPGSVDPSGYGGGGWREFLLLGADQSIILCECEMQSQRTKHPVGGGGEKKRKKIGSQGRGEVWRLK
jgi:hypothetical protein